MSLDRPALTLGMTATWLRLSGDPMPWRLRHCVDAGAWHHVDLQARLWLAERGIQVVR